MTDPQGIYPQLVARYRDARREWRHHLVRECAADERMDEESYCRRYVAEMGPIVTPSVTVAMVNVAWLEGAAYDEAGVQNARASALTAPVGRGGQAHP